MTDPVPGNTDILMDILMVTQPQQHTPRHTAHVYLGYAL